MSGHEQKYIDDAFFRGHVFPNGLNVRGLEEDICKYVSVASCTCLSSGTAAIHLALVMLGIERGDDVICSTFTFSASANPIVYQGATPIFVDSEMETWNMDPRLLREAITDRMSISGKKPKAIILVHLYGMPARIDEITSIANEFNIPIIEDAAEALGSRFREKYCGTFGELGVYSFNGNKIITTSGGGAIISNNAEYCERAVYLATQARDPAPHYQHSEIGYNYRLSNISAGIGRGQMEVLSERVEKRRENHIYYKEQLEEIQGLSFLEEPSSDYYSNFWLSTLTIEPCPERSAEKLRHFLDTRGIESRPLWKPMHLQPIFKNYPSYETGVSERLFRTGICLPSSSNITDEQRNYVVASIAEFLKSGNVNL